MSENSSQEYIYKISSIQFVWMFLFSIAMSYFMTTMAYDNLKGLRIKFITFSVSEATMIYWAMAILFGITAVLSIFMGYISWRKPKAVQLYPTYANLPKASIFGGQINIPYDSITGINRRRLTATQEMIEIKSAHGISRLVSKFFIGVFGYEDFISELKNKMISLPRPISKGL